MRIVNTQVLIDFWKKHSGTQKPLQAWLAEMRANDWKSFNDLKTKYPSASLVDNNRVIFHIKGNRYWLVALVLWKDNQMLVEFLGTHAEYDKLNFQKP